MATTPTSNIKHYYVYLVPANANPTFLNPHYEYHGTTLPQPKHVRGITPYWIYSEWEEAFLPINRHESCVRRLPRKCIRAVDGAVRARIEEWRQSRRRRAFEKWTEKQA